MTPEQKKQFFHAECRRFIEFWGLHEWSIDFEVHEGSARGMCLTNGITSPHEGDGMLATLSCGVDWIKEQGTTKEKLSRVAFHEVMELILAKVRDYAVNQDYAISPREIDDEIHRVIMRFENKIFPLI